MTIVQARDAIWARLKEHIACPIVLADDIEDMPEAPYCYYSILAPRITNHAFGLIELEETQDGFIRRRSEPVSATMSFTFCSKNRDTPDGGYIFGEDEALELAEKAHGFFLLNGHNIVTEHGDIVIQNIGTVANRSGFLVTDTIRRYGFDVRFGYVRTDEMPTTTILDTGIKRNIHQQEGGNAKWQKT